MRIFCGHIIHSILYDELEIKKGIVVIANNGIIADIFRNDNPENYIDEYKLKHKFNENEDELVILNNYQFIMPGLIDSHCHAPQMLNLGVGNDMELLDWLHHYTFPKECKFKDVEFATTAYKQVVKKLLKEGTTCCSYYATIHLEATKILADTMIKYGQRGYVGKVCMDRNSPDYYIETTQQSLDDNVKLIEYLKDSELVRPIITPRFAISCSSELMNGLGDLANKYDLLIQTHMSENKKEIETVQDLHPNLKYAQVYKQHNLFNEKTLLAHCIHLDDEEIEIMKEYKVGISHCPLSNINIMSGLLNLNKLVIKHNFYKVGLATDISGGYSSSMLHVIVNAINTSKIVHFYENHNSRFGDRPINLANAFYLATVGNAKVLHLDNRIGNFEVGKCFDALLIDTRVSTSNMFVSNDDSMYEKFEKFIYTGDDRNIVRIYVDGKRVDTDLK